MKKVGLSAECTNGNIASLASQIDHFKSLGIDSVEIPLFETDIICGKKIVSSELGILINILDNKDIAKTVHGEMSVNLLDSEYFDDHKEILKKDIEVSGAIGATHLVTHFGQTTNTIFDDQAAYNDLLTRQNDCYAEMGEYAKRHGVVLAIENLFPFTVKNYAPMPSEIGAQVKKLIILTLNVALIFPMPTSTVLAAMLTLLMKLNTWDHLPNIFICMILLGSCSKCGRIWNPKRHPMGLVIYTYLWDGVTFLLLRCLKVSNFLKILI